MMAGGFRVALIAFATVLLPATGNGQQGKAKPKKTQIKATAQPTGSPTLAPPTPTAALTFTVTFAATVTPENTPTRTPQATATKDQPYWTREVFWPPNWSDWALVILGGIAAFVGLRTLNAMLRQASAADISANAAQGSAEAAKQSAEAAVKATAVAKEALHLDQRPWIVASGIFTEEAPSPSAKEIQFEVKIANTGKTPALGVAARVKYDETDLDDPPPTGEQTFTDEPDNAPTSVLGPGVRQAIGGALPTDVYLRAQREKKLWVLGVIRYSDIFGTQHFTKFSFRLHLSTMDPDVWEYTGPHNDST